MGNLKLKWVYIKWPKYSVVLPFGRSNAFPIADILAQIIINFRASGRKMLQWEIRKTQKNKIKKRKNAHFRYTRFTLQMIYQK